MERNTTSHSTKRNSRISDPVVKATWVTSRFSLKRAIRWFTRVGLEAVEFRPEEPAGTDNGEVWTTQQHLIKGTQLVSYRNGKEYIRQPIEPLCGKVILDGFFAWKVTSVRNGRFVHYKMKPAWFASRKAKTMGDTISGNYVIRREVQDDGVSVNIGKLGMFASVKINAVEEAAVNANLVVNGKKTQPYSIQQVLRAVDKVKWADDNPAVASRFLADLWCDQWTVGPTSHTQRPEQIQEFVDDVRMDDQAPAHETGWIVGPEIAEHADKAPMMGKNTDLVAIHERLDKPRNLKFDLSEEARDVISAFLDRAFPAIPLMEPWSIDKVLEHQDGPLQRARNERDRAFLDFTSVKTRIKAMLKKEPVSNDGAVRNISTLNTDHNIKLARYTLAKSEYLKRFPWYGPGMTPAQISQRVVEIAQGEDYLTESDIEKMDACKGVGLLHAFHIESDQRLFVDSAEVVQLRMNSNDASAMTDTGIVYYAGTSQPSGQSDTTVDNTGANGLIIYYGYVKEGYSYDEAWDLLMRKATATGDDYLGKNDPECLSRAAAEFGYKLKVEVKHHGETLTYLSRKFPYAWDGGMGSYQDIDRLLRKSHMSFGDPSRSVQQLAADKWAGYHGLDPASSVYRAFKECVERVTGLVGGLTWAEMPWFLREHPGESWPQLADVDTYFELETGIPTSVYVNWANSCTTWQQWLKGPGFRYQNTNKRKLNKVVDPTNPFSDLPARNEVAVAPCVTTGDEGKENRKQLRQETKKAIRDEAKRHREYKARNRTKKPPQQLTTGLWMPPPAAAIGTVAADPWDEPMVVDDQVPTTSKDQGSSYRATCAQVEAITKVVPILGQPGVVTKACDPDDARWDLFEDIEKRPEHYLKTKYWEYANTVIKRRDGVG